MRHFDDHSAPPARPARAAAAPAVLTLDGVGKSFGELAVLTDVSLALHAGETLGLIGPNGAGKTSLFNAITGFVPPDRGRIEGLGDGFSRLSPEARVRRGLVRTFQKSMAFPALSVRENLALAVRRQQGSGYHWWGGRRATAEADAAAEAWLDDSPLRGQGSTAVHDLSYGAQRIVDVLVSLALRPRILLLDEPTAGLAQQEAQDLLDLVRRHDPGMAVMLIAHDLDIVFSRCDRIAVMELGRLVTVDTPDAVRRHPQVQAAYLGSALSEGEA